MTDIEIRNQDKKVELGAFLRLPRFPITAVLDNIRSAYNVGSIFRTADAARIERICLCGYTPLPQNEKVEKTALGACDYVPWMYYARTSDAVAHLKGSGVFVAAFETTNQSMSYYDLSYSGPMAFVFGNEKDGIDFDVLKMADAIVEVPTWGMKNSINVANIFGITVYEALRNMRK